MTKAVATPQENAAPSRTEIEVAQEGQMIETEVVLEDQMIEIELAQEGRMIETEAVLEAQMTRTEAALEDQKIKMQADQREGRIMAIVTIKERVKLERKSIAKDSSLYFRRIAN